MIIDWVGVFRSLQHEQKGEVPKPQRLKDAPSLSTNKPAIQTSVSVKKGGQKINLMAGQKHSSKTPPIVLYNTILNICE